MEAENNKYQYKEPPEDKEIVWWKVIAPIKDLTGIIKLSDATIFHQIPVGAVTWSYRKGSGYSDKVIFPEGNRYGKNLDVTCFERMIDKDAATLDEFINDLDDKVEQYELKLTQG